MRAGALRQVTRPPLENGADTSSSPVESTLASDGNEIAGAPGDGQKTSETFQLLKKQWMSNFKM